MRQLLPCLLERHKGACGLALDNVTPLPGIFVCEETVFEGPGTQALNS
jgi:hypothetical protein